MGRKKLVCLVHRCSEPPYIGGRCRVHHQEHWQKERDRDEAVEALHKGTIDGALPTDSSLREQLFAIRKWWFRACDALNFDRKDAVLQDEAEYAMEWCIALTREIVTAERTVKEGCQPSYMLEHTAKWVHERFANLEKGLMSNGLPRQEPLRSR